MAILIGGAVVFVGAVLIGRAMVVVGAVLIGRAIVNVCGMAIGSGQDGRFGGGPCGTADRPPR